jgi:hypothetical protein
VVEAAIAKAVVDNIILTARTGKIEDGKNICVGRGTGGPSANWRNWPRHCLILGGIEKERLNELSNNILPGVKFLILDKIWIF